MLIPNCVIPNMQNYTAETCIHEKNKADLSAGLVQVHLFSGTG